MLRHLSLAFSQLRGKACWILSQEELVVRRMSITEDAILEDSRADNLKVPPHVITLVQRSSDVSSNAKANGTLEVQRKFKPLGGQVKLSVADFVTALVTAAVSNPPITLAWVA
ncbi:hypothetical protein EVAR_24454_1 [Eumeta japonica]|uniref:Uncharacterized protein n=1 Tax=Eumeta variegata TaxID=151549 RepID=A0A4C1WV05_EUMVA|nr:hypothetical protein EVAR_24454_1 [Eumeta japonica]